MKFVGNAVISESFVFLPEVERQTRLQKTLLKHESTGLLKSDL